MSFPARVYPEQIELALVHSRDNVNDKSQTIVDLMGGNRVKNFDMDGMGSNATKDLGLLSVVASKDCFMLSSGKSANNNNRNLAQNMAGPLAAAMPQQTADAMPGARLDLNLLRAVGSDIVTMPALMTEIQVIMGNPLAYPADVVEKINTLLVDVGNLNNLMNLGVLPEGRTSIESLAQILSLRIAENSMALFDTAKISKDLFEFVTNTVDKARAQFNITSEDMDYKMMAMEGRLNDENYLARAVDDLRQNLMLALQSPNITDAQRIEITKVLETLTAATDGTKNVLNITAVLAALSPSIVELLPENKQSALMNAIATTIDAAHVTAATQLGVTIDQIRTIDTAMLAMASAAQDLGQKLELLSPAEREILTQLQASVATYQQSPLTLATIGEIAKLQTMIADQMNGQNNVVNLESFKNISPEMMAAILKSADTVLPLSTSILAEKWNMSPQEVHSIATTLMAAKEAYELELKGATNPAQIESIQKALNDIAQVQLNPFTPQSAAIIANLMQSPIMEKLAVNELSSAGLNVAGFESRGETLSPLESLIRLKAAQADVVNPTNPHVAPEPSWTQFRPENFGFYAAPVVGGTNVIAFPNSAPTLSPTQNPSQPANDTTGADAKHTAPTEAPNKGTEGAPITDTKGTGVDSTPIVQPTNNPTGDAQPAPVHPEIITPEQKVDPQPVQQPANPPADPKPEAPTENKGPQETPKPEDQSQPTENKEPLPADPEKPANDPTKKTPDIKEEFDDKCKKCNKPCDNCGADFKEVAIPPSWNEFADKYKNETGHVNLESTLVRSTGAPTPVLAMIGDQLIAKHGAEHVMGLIKNGEYSDLIRSEHQRQLTQMKETLTKDQINEFKFGIFEDDNIALVRYTETLKAVQSGVSKDRQENKIADSSEFATGLEKELARRAGQNPQKSDTPENRKDEFNDKGDPCPAGFKGGSKPSEEAKTEKGTSNLRRDRSANARPRGME